VADANSGRCERQREPERRDEQGASWRESHGCCLDGRIFNTAPRGDWSVEPDVGRVAHGVPARVDRLRGLGNSLVPQIAEWIAHRIAEAEVTL
jgi:hypothetical protein